MLTQKAPPLRLLEQGASHLAVTPTHLVLCKLLSNVVMHCDVSKCICPSRSSSCYKAGLLVVRRLQIKFLPGAFAIY